MLRFIGFSSVSCGAILTATCVAVGCGQPPSPPQAPAAATKPNEKDHDHPHGQDGHHDHGAGPHGGTLADWGGGKYHVEFTVDHDKKEAVIYVLGKDEKTAAPIITSEGTLLLTIKEPAFQVRLVARPLEGETDIGLSSCYVGTHESLGIVREFSGTISGDVEGVPYAGEFAEQPHDHK